MRAFLFSLILAPFVVFAQTDSTSTTPPPPNWNKGGSFGVNFNQATLSKYWAAGGSNSISGASYFSAIMDYKKDKTFWNNSLELGYGMIKQDKEKPRKADDKIIFASNYGRQLSPNGKWFFTSNVDFRTQFDKGFSAEDLENYISKFMAPGYLLLSVGIDYKPNKYFSLSMSPVAGKFTFVNDKGLSDAGAFGVDPGKTVREELGGTITALFDKEIFKNVQYKSKLILFSNYVKNPDKVDVNWENTITMKVNSVLSANIYNQLIYDYDIKFADKDNPNEVPKDKVQFKNILGIGLTLKFGGKRG